MQCLLLLDFSSSWSPAAHPSLPALYQLLLLSGYKAFIPLPMSEQKMLINLYWEHLLLAIDPQTAAMLPIAAGWQRGCACLKVSEDHFAFLQLLSGLFGLTFLLLFIVLQGQSSSSGAYPWPTARACH